MINELITSFQIKLSRQRIYKYIQRGFTNLIQILRSKNFYWNRTNKRYVSNKSLLRLEIEDMLAFPRRRYLDRANKILAGKLIVDNVFNEELNFNITNFDWNIHFSKTPTTFQLYLQSMNPVGDLAAAYHFTRNEEFYTLAMHFIQSWITFSKSLKSSTNEYIWDHHASASRAENILYFLLVGIKHELFPNKTLIPLIDLLALHGDFLSKPGNYMTNHNHGVFQDKALAYLSFALERPEWMQITQNRLKRQWDYLFTGEMVCVENSFVYQRINVELFLEIARFLQRINNPWGEELINNLSIAQDFMGYALKPTGMCATFGDTFASDYSKCTFISPDGVLAYASRKGKIGKKPDVRSIVYPESGYYFGREYWENEDSINGGAIFSDAVWTMFRSGYKSITHRQADDNSFILSAKGHDIFVDSGLYSTMFRDPIRIYLRSANAHNTIIVDETSFSFQRTDCIGLSGIIYHDIGLDRGYDYVVGHNSLYLGIFHVRHFVYLENAIFIFDEIESIHEHKFSQLFHCGRDILIESTDENVILCRIADTGCYTKLKQLGNNPTLSVTNGGEEGAQYGLCSDNYNEYYCIDTIKYDQYGQTVNFATLITLEQDNESDVTNITYYPAQRMLSFNKGNIEQTLIFKQFERRQYVPHQVFVMENYEIIQDNGRFKIINRAKYLDKMQYAWYIINKKNRKPVNIQMYSDLPSYNIDFTILGVGAYSIRAFVMDLKSKKKASQIIAHVIYEKNKWTYHRELEFDPEWRINSFEVDIAYDKYSSTQNS